MPSRLHAARVAERLLLGSRFVSLLGGILRARFAERSAVDLTATGFAVTFAHAVDSPGELDDSTAQSRRDLAGKQNAARRKSCSEAPTLQQSLPCVM